MSLSLPVPRARFPVLLPSVSFHITLLASDHICLLMLGVISPVINLFSLAPSPFLRKARNVCLHGASRVLALSISFAQ